ncbi:unnamed protein product [Paramecium pentaurelia]|uniref:Uncharacterized protein n=1 Tax=Paramecium pentaurelia TaxID=43138 RepID=A0A8S1X416_9CILI|nr:unnamed protein product [Paramecium pentaurelia]
MLQSQKQKINHLHFIYMPRILSNNLNIAMPQLLIKKTQQFWLDLKKRSEFLNQLRINYFNQKYQKDIMTLYLHLIFPRNKRIHSFQDLEITPQ